MNLRLAYFGLMGVGLALASGFLWFDKLSGGEWVTMCGILFASDRAAYSLDARRMPATEPRGEP